MLRKKGQIKSQKVNNLNIQLTYCFLLSWDFNEIIQTASHTIHKKRMERFGLEKHGEYEFQLKILISWSL